MKKNMSILGLLLALFLCVPFLAACGDDDDNELPLPIQGKWYSLDYLFNLRTEDNKWRHAAYTELLVCRYPDSGNECQIWIYDSDRSLIKKDHGTFKLNKSHLTVWWDDINQGRPVDMYVEINGDEMIAGVSTWTRI